MPTIRNLFRIDHPLVQAPMAGVQLAALAAAVSEAGAHPDAGGQRLLDPAERAEQ